MTGIEWTQEVWNPTTGCDRISAGCDHCYALTMAKRLKGMGQAKYQRDGDPRTSGPGFGVSVHPDVLTLPLSWRKPRRIFVNSMSDVFHDEVPDEFIARVFAVMAIASQHTFQLPTKRHGRMRSLLNSHAFWTRVAVECLDLSGQWPVESVQLDSHRLGNLWLGVSVEDQKWADIRIPALLDTPAAVRFISAEPLLGPLDLGAWLGAMWKCRSCGFVQGQHTGSVHCFDCGTRNWPLPVLALDWVIAGGESGSGARPCDVAWLRSLVRQCSYEAVPIFIKQLGSVLGRELGAGPKGGDIDAFPEDLRVREFPGIVAEKQLDMGRTG